MATLLACRMLRLPVSTAHGRPRRVHRANRASRFPKSEQTAQYATFPILLLSSSLNFLMTSSSRVQVRTTPPQLSLPPAFNSTSRITAPLSVTPAFPLPPPTTPTTPSPETVETAPKE